MFLGSHHEVLLRPLFSPNEIFSREPRALSHQCVTQSRPLFSVSAAADTPVRAPHTPTRTHALPCHGVMQTVQHPQYIRFHDGAFPSEATNSKARDGTESVVMWWSVKTMLNVMLAEFW